MTKVKLFPDGVLKFPGKKYQEWIENNPHVKVVSTTFCKDTLVVTYEEN